MSHQITIKWWQVNGHYYKCDISSCPSRDAKSELCEVVTKVQICCDKSYFADFLKTLMGPMLLLLHSCAPAKWGSLLRHSVIKYLWFGTNPSTDFKILYQIHNPDCYNFWKESWNWNCGAETKRRNIFRPWNGRFLCVLNYQLQTAKRASGLAVQKLNFSSNFSTFDTRKLLRLFSLPYFVMIE